MNLAEQIEDFVDQFHYTPNKVGRPLWIGAIVEDSDGNGAQFHFDFKNDDARRAFGALCHRLYTSSEKWKSETHN